MNRQVICTTVFGPSAETVTKTFSSFLKVPGAEPHVFVYNNELPKNQHPRFHYHLVEHDPAFVSVRRDALFRRWTLPDRLESEHVLVVDGTDAVCVQPLPDFGNLLRGASIAAAPEWGPPIRILGQGFTGSYLNAGVTFWHLPDSKEIRSEIVARGRAHYRGPFDDQTVLNEVVQTQHPDKLTILPSQYNWRALYKQNFRGWQHHWRDWPRVDSLDGVSIYHNQRCIDEVLQALELRDPLPRAWLPNMPTDRKPLSRSMLLWRRIAHRLIHS